jgi:hypothetical protein
MIAHGARRRRHRAACHPFELECQTIRCREPPRTNTANGTPAAGQPERQGNKLHPNRAGYAAMAHSIDLNMLRPPRVAKRMAAVAK